MHCCTVQPAVHAYGVMTSEEEKPEKLFTGTCSSLGGFAGMKHILRGEIWKNFCSAVTAEILFS